MDGSFGLLAAKYGPNVGHVDVEEARKKFEAERGPADTRLNLREIPSLESHRSSLVNRIADRRHFISVIEPQIPILQGVVDQLKSDLKAVQDALKDGVLMGGAKAQAARIGKKLDHAVWDLESEVKRLDVAKTILKATEEGLRKFDSGPDGARLKKLRALDRDSSRPSTHRGSGIAQEVLLDAAQGRIKL